MKALQKVKVTVQAGKVAKKEKIGSERPVADSIAEDLLIQAKEVLSKDAISAIKGIRIFEVWEEGKPLKQAEKKEEPKEKETA